MSNDAPIGIFDSGIGGLTVVQEVIRQLPHESLIYFGDTARVPYGPKSAETVQRYSREIAQFLTGEGVKAVVVACNTVTAHALPMLEAELDVPVVGVVQPGARAAVKATRSNRIGVIGTVGTIRSGAYERAIHAIDSEAAITARACPLFVPLVEEGWIDHLAARLIAEEYVTPLRSARIDTLVLGCTHYPLLKGLLGAVVGRDVRLIDSAAETAAETARVLSENDLATSRDKPVYRFVSSDEPAQFLQFGARFLGDVIERVEVRTLG